MSDYSQTRSFNVGIAQDTSVEAAMIYDDLVYAQRVFGQGYFFRSYEQMLRRFPFMSEQTIRRHVKRLVDGGWLSTQVRKVNGKPICHYQIERFLSAKMEETMVSAKMEETYNIETKKKLKSTRTDSEIISVGAATPPNSPPAPRPADALLRELIQMVNPREKVTTERARMLNARLKDYTVEEVLSAAKAFSKSDWHIANKQMSIDNLLAPSKFGRWYAARNQRDEAPNTAKYSDEEMARMKEADKAESARRLKEFQDGIADDATE